MFRPAMRALCPACGYHHEVVRVLDDAGDHRDVYQVAPLEGCDRVWLSDKDVLEAQARFNREPMMSGDEDVE
jgi:hypothetical protein